MKAKIICSKLLLISLIVAVLFKFTFWFIHPMLTWADQSVYLGMGGLLLEGKVPYRDFFDFNLPLIIYLNAIPMALSRLLSQPPPLMLDFCVLVLLVTSMWICNRLFALSYNRIDYFSKISWLFAMVIFNQWQMSDFAQREHLFVLFTAPYLVLRGLKVKPQSDKQSRYLYWAVGILAALGANIKPHFLIILAVFELLASLPCLEERSITALKARFFRSEIKAFVLFTLLYGLHFLLYPAVAWKIFLEQAIPIYLNGSVWFAHTLIASLYGDDECVLPIYGLLAITFICLPLTGKSRLITPLLGYCWSSLIIYLVTGGTWVYRLLPVEAGSMFLLAVVSGICLASVRGKFIHEWGRLQIAISAVVLIYTIYITGSTAKVYYDFASFVPKVSLVPCGYKWPSPYVDFNAVYYSILKHSDIGDNVIYIGTGVRPGYPAILQTNRRPGSRYLHGMILPMLEVCIQNKKGPQYTDMLAEVLHNYGEDVLHSKAKLVYFQNGVTDQFGAEAFRQKYLSQYSDLGRLESMGCTVYKRLDTSIEKIVATPINKKEMLLKVLLKQITVEECAEKLLMKPEDVKETVKKLSYVLDQTLSNDAGGGEEELAAKLKTAEEEKAGLIKTIDKLLGENLEFRRRLTK